MHANPERMKNTEKPVPPLKRKNNMPNSTRKIAPQVSRAWGDSLNHFNNKSRTFCLMTGISPLGKDTPTSYSFACCSVRCPDGKSQPTSVPRSVGAIYLELQSLMQYLLRLDIFGQQNRYLNVRVAHYILLAKPRRLNAQRGVIFPRRVLVNHLWHCEHVLATCRFRRTLSYHLPNALRNPDEPLSTDGYLCNGWPSIQAQMSPSRYPACGVPISTMSMICAPGLL